MHACEHHQVIDPISLILSFEQFGKRRLPPLHILMPKKKEGESCLFMPQQNHCKMDILLKNFQPQSDSHFY